MYGFGGIISYSNQDIYEERMTISNVMSFLIDQKAIKKNQGLTVPATKIQYIMDDIEQELSRRYETLKEAHIIKTAIADVLSYDDQFSCTHQEFAICSRNWENILYDHSETLRSIQTTPENLLSVCKYRLT